MTIRVHRKNRFTTVPNEIIEFKEMSFEARFVLIYLLSRPDGWIVRNSDVEAQSKAGKDKVSSILHEIQSNGFMYRWKERSNGQFCWRSEVFESQKDCAEWLTENSHQTGFDPHGEKPHQTGFTDAVLTPMVELPPDRIYRRGFDPLIVNTELINTDPEILIDSLPYTHSDPERVCEEIETETEPESVIVPDTPKTLPVFSSPIGEDNFSAAARRNSSTEGFPIGPWGQDLFSIHAGFMAAVIGKWRKGDTQKAKTFGSMVDEEVRGCIQKYWKKDWTNLQLDWTEYEDSTKRLAQTVRDRMAQGVEISTQEQKILTDRVMGPEHLRHQDSDSVPQQALLTPERVQRQASASIGILPAAITGISESDLEETKRAIEAARPKVVGMNQGLFQGREPIEAFMCWLEQEAEKHHVPGLSRRLIALSLGRRPEMQTAYLESLNHEF